MSSKKTSNYNMTAKLLFKMLPVQVLISSIGAINSFLTTVFATNYVGEAAMSAVGLYGPISLLFEFFSTMLMLGAVVICGRHLGKNEIDKVQNVFTLDIILCTIISVVAIIVMVLMGLLDLTDAIAPDNAYGVIFNNFLLGQAFGVFPFFIGNQLAVFLSLENKSFRTSLASIFYIISNLFFNILFVRVLHLEAIGLALASSLGLWVFMLVQAQYYFTNNAFIKLKLKGLDWTIVKEIVSLGFLGAMGKGYLTIRGFIVNSLITTYVGAVGISAFAASSAILNFFWAIPTGMVNVSRMMMSVSIGEEDRTTLTNVMRTVLFRFIPLQCVISAFIIFMAKPFTMVFFQNTADPVFNMTMWGFWILPICMPLSLLRMHLNCYAIASGQKFVVYLYGILDGFIFVCLFTAILIPFLGINSVYFANVLNSALCIIVGIVYATIKNKKMPTCIDELMVIPDDFGVDDDHRIEFIVKGMEDVIGSSEIVQTFCLNKGIDERRSYYASLGLEEMAGNVVNHGFTMDKKLHYLSARVTIKNEDVIVCIKDDCQPFDPVRWKSIVNPDDKTKNIGLRLIYKIDKNFTYLNVFGLNVLTIRI